MTPGSLGSGTAGDPGRAAPGGLVLLVDDDQDLLTSLSGALRRYGYEVAIALDAVAAVRTAVQLRPRAIVLDVGLPGGEGVVVMKRIHALPQLAGVPVLMMSGRDPQRYRDQALAAGAAAYLTKPVRPDGLVAALRTALGEDEGATGATRAATHQAGEHAGKLVLLVDDDEDLLVALAAPLRRSGFDVAVASDAVTAVSVAVKRRPDAVIMDIGLPGGDGTMVMQRLHALPQLAGVPVVIVSGRDPERHREAALAAGAAAYLTKPVEAGELVGSVIRALGGPADGPGGPPWPTGVSDERVPTRGEAATGTITTEGVEKGPRQGDDAGLQVS